MSKQQFDQYEQKALYILSLDAQRISRAFQTCNHISNIIKIYNECKRQFIEDSIEVCNALYDAYGFENPIFDNSDDYKTVEDLCLFLDSIKETCKINIGFRNWVIISHDLNIEFFETNQIGEI